MEFIEATPAGLLVHADAHFRMGSSHGEEGSPCQDWATAGMAGGLPFAVISDGCSSSGRTDLGARLLALAAARTLRDGGDLGTEALRRRILNAAASTGMMLGLRTDDMDATLGMAFATPEGGARAVLFGDGVVAARVRDGLDVRIVEWAGNLPGYPWYAMETDRREAFMAQSHNLAGEAGTAPCRVSRYLIGTDGAAELRDVIDMDAGTGLQGFCVGWLPDSLPDAIAVMSDGVLQFSGTQWPRVVGEMAGFKAAREGEFVRRRMHRALQDLAKHGIRPVDDVSVAAIAAAIG